MNDNDLDTQGKKEERMAKDNWRKEQSGLEILDRRTKSSSKSDAEAVLCRGLISHLLTKEIISSH